PVAQALAQLLPFRAVDLTGRLSLRETVALLSQLDLFLSPDTGTMHAACAVGTPSVSVFGPSDPARYFSGGTGESGRRHVVVRAADCCGPLAGGAPPPRRRCAPAAVPSERMTARAWRGLRTPPRRCKAPGRPAAASRVTSRVRSRIASTRRPAPGPRPGARGA